jgi:predicted dehydrogenase
MSRLVPGSRCVNVEQLYARLADRIRDGKPAAPGFDVALTRHRRLDAIVRASRSGRKQFFERAGDPTRSWRDLGVRSAVCL